VEQVVVVQLVCDAFGRIVYFERNAGLWTRWCSHKNTHRENERNERTKTDLRERERACPLFFFFKNYDNFVPVNYKNGADGRSINTEMK